MCGVVWSGKTDGTWSLICKAAGQFEKTKKLKTQWNFSFTVMMEPLFCPSKVISHIIKQAIMNLKIVHSTTYNSMAHLSVISMWLMLSMRNAQENHGSFDDKAVYMWSCRCGNRGTMGIVQHGLGVTEGNGRLDSDLSVKVSQEEGSGSKEACRENLDMFIEAVSGLENTPGS